MTQEFTNSASGRSEARSMGRYWVLGGVVLLVLVGGAGYALGIHNGSTNPDRVVGIEERCTARNTLSESQEVEHWGSFCEYFVDYITTHLAAGEKAPEFAGVDQSYSFSVGVWDRRKVLTIRTSQGPSYTIAVAMTTKVSVGDPWPPK